MNCLIVSLGSIGRRHLGNLRALRPDARIGVLRLAAPAGEPLPPGADVQFRSMEEALEFAPEVAIIASPAPTHVAAALPLVRAGVPLLIEKPLADRAEAAQELLAEAARRNVAIMTGYNFRFQPALAEAHRLLAAGAIGEVRGVRAEVGQYLPDWRPAMRYQDSVSARRALGGGPLLELSHEIDYVCWFFGRPARVGAQGGRYGGLEIDVEDMVSLTLEFEQPRRLVHIHLDFLQRAASRSCKFIGSEGTLVWDGLAGLLHLYRADQAGWQRLDGFVLQDRNEVYVAELRHFLDSIARGTAPEPDGLDGLRVLEVVEAARLSLGRRQTVELHG